MKHKYLLATVSALWVVGCGNTPEPTEQEKAQSLDNELERQKIEKKHKKMRQEKKEYMFSDSYNSRGPDPNAVGGSSSISGIVSSSFKSTIRNIWSKFEKIGFSGFDPAVVSENTQYEYDVSRTHGTLYNAFAFLPQSPKDFAHNIVTWVYNIFGHYPYQEVIKSMQQASTLLGLTYNNKALTIVRTADGKYEAVLANEFRKPPAGEMHYEYIPPKIDSDVPVTQAQIDEWNQVFIDALKEDPFFGKQMSEPADASGSVSTLAAMKGQSAVDAAQLRVNGVAGAQVDLGLPVYVQLKGDVDDRKTTEGVTGLVAYRFGNTVVGAIQSYANASNTAHTETSMVAAQLIENMYLEGQLGSVSFEGGSGMRSQVRVGIDTPYGMPFVQLTHRDFGAKTDTAAYVGLEVSSLEIKTAEYTFSTQAMAKVGRHSDKGSVGAIEGTAKLSFRDGLAIDTQLTLESQASPKLSLNVSFEQ